MRDLLLTIGTFDIPHAGHAAFLRKCEAFANDVVVGVNSDAFVMQYKGVKPEYTQLERLDIIRELGYRAELNTSAGFDLIDRVDPNVIAIGSDWARKDYFAQIDTSIGYLEDYDIALVYIPYTEGISSTDIRRRLA